MMTMMSWRSSAWTNLRAIRFEGTTKIKNVSTVIDVRSHAETRLEIEMKVVDIDIGINIGIVEINGISLLMKSRYICTMNLVELTLFL